MSSIEADSVTAITKVLSQAMEAMDKKLGTINTSLELTLENKLGQIKVDLNCDLGHTIDTKLNQIKVNLSTDLQHSIGSTLKKGMDDIVDSLGKRQDAFEAKSDQ